MFQLAHFWEDGLDVDDIKNNEGFTVNNDFFCHEWRSHEWKSLPNRLTSDNKSLLTPSLFDWAQTVTNVILLFTRYFMSRTHKSTKKLSSSAHFAIVAKGCLFWLNIVTSTQLICDVTRTRDTGIVTSYSSIVIVRANWRKGDLHWSITTAYIDTPPPDIHGLACKKIIYLIIMILMIIMTIIINIIMIIIMII